MPELRRRELVSLGARGFLALQAVLPLLGQSLYAADPVASQLEWSRFIDQLGVLAKEQNNPKWDQPAYLEKVRSLLTQLNLGDTHIKEVIARYKNARKKFPEIKELHKEQNFQVSLLEFEPGERIGLHDHPDMTGCILCSEGSAVVRNFTLLPQESLMPQKKNAKVQLRQESVVTMTPGVSGMLTSTTANIHDLVANSFTRLIDVFTPPYNDDRSRRSRWFDLDQTPPKADGIFTATVR
jgi:cysteamine dioxygenase